MRNVEYKTKVESWGSSVRIVTGYGLDGVRFLEGGLGIFLFSTASNWI
jgi:hypothetical protein